jgi:hypothetical protein
MNRYSPLGLVGCSCAETYSYMTFPAFLENKELEFRLEHCLQGRPFVFFTDCSPSVRFRSQRIVSGPNAALLFAQTALTAEVDGMIQFVTYSSWPYLNFFPSSATGDGRP